MVEEEQDENVLHYDELWQVPKEIQKYWHQRYLIFSRYDDGIQLTRDAWFGVTPESVALRIAADVAESAPANKSVIIDAFGGAGGNAIAFALSGRWEQIFAIEKDPDTIACAKRNAEIYGVSKKIWWIKGDCFDEIKKRFKAMGDKAVIFASPPWGGPSYTSDEIFDLNTMEPYNIEKLHSEFSKITKDIVFYLPRNSNLNQLIKYAAPGKEMSVVHYCMNGASKALSAYLGDFSEVSDDSND